MAVVDHGGPQSGEPWFADVARWARVN